MKNTYIILIMAASLFTGALTGCQPRSDQQSAQKSTAADASDAVANENTASSESDNDSAESNIPTDTAQNSDVPDDEALSNDNTQNSSEAEFVMEEQTLLDYDGVTVTAVSWDSDEMALKIQAQNTSDQDYIIQFSETSINNYMMEPIFSLNIAAGSQAEKNAEFNPSDLSDCGIEQAAQIQMKVNLLDAISFDVLYTSEYVTVPTGQSTDEQPDDESGQVLYDQEGLKLISRGFVDDPDWGKLWKVYISNESGEDLAIYTPTITLNGNTLDVLFSVSVPTGKKAVGTMTIFQEDLDTYQISDVTSAEVTLRLQDPQTFQTLRTIDNIPLELSAE